MNLQASCPRDRPIVSWAPYVVVVALALMVWWICRPGFMSADSIAQYGQAKSGQFTSLHPPLMAAVLRLVLFAGGDLGFLMLIQCLAGMLGIVALAKAVLRQVAGKRAIERSQSWLAIGVLLGLLLPVSPLTFYLMTFWKDAWAMVLMLWLLERLLPGNGRDGEAARLVTTVVLAAFLGLVRHNAVVVLPIVGAILAHRSRRRPGLAAVLAFAPLGLFALVGTALDRGLRVADRSPAPVIMVLDLLGLCATGPEVCAELPWTRAHVLDPDALGRYLPGDIGFFAWGEPKVVDYPAVARDRSRLTTEYWRAIRRFPLVFARVKLEAFSNLLGLKSTYYFVHATIVDNPFGLHLEPRSAGARELLRSATEGVAKHPIMRWVSGVHALWIAIDLIGIAALWSWHKSPAGQGVGPLASALTVPLAYYLSYLVATPVHDFRFMYPATLAVQCFLFAGAVGIWVRKAPADLACKANLGTTGPGSENARRSLSS